MLQVIEQTHEEKVKMYNESSKRELIEMIIEANKHLACKQSLYYQIPFPALALEPEWHGWASNFKI